MRTCIQTLPWLDRSESITTSLNYQLQNINIAEMNDYIDNNIALTQLNIVNKDI